MNLQEMTIGELIDLKRKVEIAIFKNSDYNIYKKTQEEKKYYLLLYGKELITYISKQLGYNIMSKRRNPQYIFPRYCMFYYLRSEGLTFGAIGQLFKVHHSSVIHGINICENLLKFQDAQFGIYHIKTNHLINQFKEKQHGEEHININNNGKEHFNADSARTQSA